MRYTKGGLGQCRNKETIDRISGCSQLRQREEGEPVETEHSDQELGLFKNDKPRRRTLPSPFITQSEDIVTIPHTGIPILYISTHGIVHVAARVAMAVNLLRSGCPKAQLMWVGLQIETIVKQTLFAVSLPGERFETEYVSTLLRDGNISMMTITRVCEPDA